MNLANAMGKFGAVLVDVVTFVKDSLTSVSDDFADWLVTESGKSALRVAVGVAMESLFNAYKAFKVEAIKLFTSVGELNFPGDQGGWKASEFFTTENQIVRFSYVSSYLATFIDDDPVIASPARELAIQKLKRNAKDEEILSQLGDPYLTPSELRWLCEKVILNRGKWYVGCLKNGLGERLTVSFYLDDDGLNVRCYLVPYERGWDDGNLFVSPARSCEASGS